MSLGAVVVRREVHPCHGPTSIVLHTFFCYTEESNFANLKVVSDLTPEDCFVQKLTYQDVNPNDGLPKCKPMKGAIKNCYKYRNSNNKIYANIVNKPTCLKDTTFAPVQCKGEPRTGRCFCFDSVGTRLFGQQWWKDADDMTCACSRRKAEMNAETNPLYFNSLHCDSMGSYEPLQCDMVSEQCWCVDPKTCDLKSPVVPKAAMFKLPCYSTLTVGTQYLRQCESKKFAQQRILYELSLHGTVGSSYGTFLCDDDGSYGNYRIVDTSAYCTWRDNTNLGSYQSTGNYTGLNCNCARDQRIFKNAGKNLNLECTGGGNYKPLQTLGGTPYCVDADGFRKTPEGAKPKSDENCGSYATYNKR